MVMHVFRFGCFIQTGLESSVIIWKKITVQLQTKKILKKALK